VQVSRALSPATLVLHPLSYLFQPFSPPQSAYTHTHTHTHTHTPRRARERRKQQESLAATKKLGEPEDEIDDVMAWVQKSRGLTEAQKAEGAARRKEEAARRRAKAAALEEEEDEEEVRSGLRLRGEGRGCEGEEGEPSRACCMYACGNARTSSFLAAYSMYFYHSHLPHGNNACDTCTPIPPTPSPPCTPQAASSAAELAGAKVKLTAEELGEGETVILTLADRGILDEKGNLHEDDEDLVLENVLAVSAGVWGGREGYLHLHAWGVPCVGRWAKHLRSACCVHTACSASLLLWKMPSLLYF
jgi:hypothetical protein